MEADCRRLEMAAAAAARIVIPDQSDRIDWSGRLFWLRKRIPPRRTLDAFECTETEANAIVARTFFVTERVIRP